MADPGSTILNLPSTVVLNDSDVLPLARPSGTSAPGTNLGISGAAIKSIITSVASRFGIFHGPFAAGVPYGQYDTIIIPNGNPNAGLIAYAPTAFTSTGGYAATNWTLVPGQSSYATTGFNVDGGMTQLATTTVTGVLSNLITNDKSSLTAAINEVKNLEFKAALVVLGVAADGSGGILTIFPTYELAEAAAPVNGDIGLIGFHRVINVDKSVNISGGAVGTAVIGYNSSGITARLHGMSALARFVSCAPATAGVVTTVEFSDLTTGPGFYLESFGLSTNGTVTISVINCRARNTGPAGATSNGTAGSGLVHFQERTCISQWNFRNCDLRSTNNVIFSGYPNAASRVTLEAATVLTPGPGKPTQDTQVINSGVTTADANFYIDNRPVYATGDTYSVLPYGTGSVVIDFNLETVQTLTATGNIAFGASANVALLKVKELYITNTTSVPIAISCPTSWTFFPGPPPTTLAASKQAVLTLRSLGTSDTTVKAAYVAQG